MNTLRPLHVLGLMLCSTPGLARGESATPLSRAQANALRAGEDPTLGELRAGVIGRSVELSSCEQTALRQAEATSPDLGDLRAGEVDLSNRDLTIIAIVVGVILILVLI